MLRMTVDRKAQKTYKRDLQLRDNNEWLSPVEGEFVSPVEGEFVLPVEGEFVS